MTTKTKNILPPLLPSTFAKASFNGKKRDATEILASQLSERPKLEAAGTA